MTKEEMIAGFAKGRELVQAFDHPWRSKPTPEELNLVDECIRELKCEPAVWSVHPEYGLIRTMKGIKWDEQKEYN